MVKKLNIKRQIRILYGYSLASSFPIADAVWVLFLLQRGYSLAQVGLAEGVFHVTSMAFEVPSGMAADLFGRKRTLMASGFAGAVSAFLLGTSSGFLGICAGMAFSALTYNLISGTLDAILYDSLSEAGEESRFPRCLSMMSGIGRVGAAAACLASPIALWLGYRGTYRLCLALSLAALATASFLREPQIDESLRSRKIWSLTEIKTRFTEHVRFCAAFLKGHPATVLKLFADAAVACPTYLLTMFLQDHLTGAGWPAAWIGIPLLLQRLSGAAGAFLGGRGGGPLRRAVFACGVLGGLGACLAGSPHAGIVILGACLAQVCEGFLEVRVSASVNREFPSSQRATMVSVDSMLYSILMVGVSPVLGGVSGAMGTGAGFLLLGLGLAAGTVLAYLAAYGGFQKKR